MSMPCYGGIVRVVIDILNNLDGNKFDIHLLLYKDVGVFSNKLRSDIRISTIEKHEKSMPENPSFYARNFTRLKELYRFFKLMNHERPDIIITVPLWGDFCGLFTILAKMFFVKTKAIMWLHCNKTWQFKIYSSPLYDKIERLTYKIANRIICPAEGVAEDLNEKFGVRKNKITVIYNPLDIEKINNLKDEKIHDNWFNNENINIISIAGLGDAQKGQSYLLKAFSVVKKRYPDANLILLGEGSDRNYFEDLARKLGIENSVIMPGFKENPYKYLKNSDMFVLPSIFEGFGCVITEAMLCGLPVISTRCPSGPEDIITNNVNGILVPVRDEKALADAIIEILTDKEKAKRLAKEGMKRARDFEVGRIAKEFEKTFIELTSQ